MTYKICYWDEAAGEQRERDATDVEIAEWETEQAAFAVRKEALLRTKYQRDREAEYPPIGDQLDALWKGGEASTTMLAQIQAVKAKYPKP
jgi:DUF2075 family protein